MLVEVGISARHIHISKESLAILFGEDHELHVFREVKQPGQYGAEETISVVGPKGSFPTVRILGPIRVKDQVEVSVSDCFKLGVKPMVRESGKIEGTPGIKLVGPKGEVDINEGVIVAVRHVHLNQSFADKEGITEGQILKAKTEGERALVFDNVIARISPDFLEEFHIDTDEANAALVRSGDKVTLVK